MTDPIQPILSASDRRIGRLARTPAPSERPPAFLDPNRIGPNGAQARFMRRISVAGTQNPQLIIDAPKDLPDPERDYKGYWWTGHRGADGPLFQALAAPRDVHQGGLGTCYLLSDLAALAAVDPKLIANLARENDDGSFTVTFHDTKNGGKLEVDVDREMVWGLGTGGIGWQNASPRGDEGAELWVAVIEKAYAMAKGSYDAVDGGWPHVTLEELTGRNFDRQFGLGAPEDTWALLKARCPGARSDWSAWESRLSSPVVLATPDAESKPWWKKVVDKLFGPDIGYAPNHAYGVLGIGESPELGKYAVLYNPWGRYEGREDGPNDGLFRVPIAELKDHFNYITYSSELWHLSIR